MENQNPVSSNLPEGAIRITVRPFELWIAPAKGCWTVVGASGTVVSKHPDQESARRSAISRAQDKFKAPPDYLRDRSARLRKLGFIQEEIMGDPEDKS